MRKALGLSTAVLWVAACGTVSPSTDEMVVARFFLEDASGEGVAAALPQSGVQIAVSPKPVITEFDLVNVEIAQVELGRCLLFQLTSAAARDLHRLSGAHQGRRLVLWLNGRPVGARRIERPFEDGTVLIFVELPDEELPELVRRLNRAVTAVREASKS